jgi:hypothetical protein
MKSTLFLPFLPAGLAAALAIGAMATTACSSTSSSTGSNSSTGSSSGDGSGATSGDNGSGAASGDSSGSSSGAGSTGSGSGSSGSGTSSPEPTDAAPAPQSDAGTVLAVDGATVEDINPTTTDFDCLKNSEWTTVGVSRYKNVLGHEAETVAAAKSASGGIFPVGTFVQLVPQEAMVKRGKGYSPASDDWEFFSLNVSASGTTIGMSGGTSAVTNFIGSCLGCHGGAKPQFDLVCGDADGGNTHGCAALPLSGAQLMGTSDPRCP